MKKTNSTLITFSVACIYSLICIAMTLKVDQRIILYVALLLLGFMFYILTPVFLTQLNKFLSRRFIVFSFIMLLVFLEGVYAAGNKGSMPLNFYLIGLFSLFSAVGIYIVMSLGDRELFFSGFQFPLLIFGLISCILFFSFDYQLLDNVNSYPALFLPSLCYLWLIKNKLFETLIVLAIVIFLTLFFDARLTLILSLLALILKLIPKNNFHKSFSWIAIGLTFATIYSAINFDPFVNELLSNRVLIWQYYIFYAAQDLLWGFGYISPEMSESTSKFLENELQRGANTQYGTQSMVIRYIYENGIVVTIVTYLFLFKYILRKTKYANLALLGYLSTLIESVKIGVPSIFGCIFLVFFLMSLTENTKKV